jgi:hypothetical protein
MIPLNHLHNISKSLVFTTLVFLKQTNSFAISDSIQSLNGAITLQDRTPNTASANYTGSFLNVAQFGKGSLSASSSNLNLTADKFAFANDPKVNIIGIITITPFNDSFLTVFALNNISVNKTVTGLTNGKVSNTVDTRLASAQGTNDFFSLFRLQAFGT